MLKHGELMSPSERPIGRMYNIILDWHRFFTMQRSEVQPIVIIGRRKKSEHQAKILLINMKTTVFLDSSP